MLVWGLVLGGIFVAVVFVVVSRFALSKARTEPVATVDPAPSHNAASSESVDGERDRVPAARQATQSAPSNAEAAGRRNPRRMAQNKRLQGASTNAATLGNSGSRSGLWIE
jgi:hypothetical protein